MNDKPDPAVVVARLNNALSHQLRSLVQYTLAAASISGEEALTMSEALFKFAEAEHADTRLLAEKVSSFGGQPTTEVAATQSDEDPERMLDLLIESERDAIDALYEVIPETGNGGTAEALEHLVEHLLMRKQQQLDVLLRVRNRAPAVSD
jgi:bacterioferritin